MRNKLDRTQMLLEGRSMNDDDMKIAILESIPNEEVWCPFCFEKQKSRATRFFLDDGKISKMVRCCICHSKMQAGSMKILFEGAKTFGMFIGGYSHFWSKIDHDEWIKKLKATFKPNEISKFWEGYANIRPQFKERQKQNQMERDYAAAGRQS